MWKARQVQDLHKCFELHFEVLHYGPLCNTNSNICQFALALSNPWLLHVRKTGLFYRSTRKSSLENKCFFHRGLFAPSHCCRSSGVRAWCACMHYLEKASIYACAQVQKLTDRRAYSLSLIFSGSSASNNERIALRGEGEDIYMLEEQVSIGVIPAGKNYSVPSPIRKQACVYLSATFVHYTP